jgi:hypothetical protein
MLDNIVVTNKNYTMQIKLINKSTKQINNNTLIIYNLLINNKFNLTTKKVISNNKFSHYTINDTQHNILLDNNIIINNKIFFNKITKLLK